MQKCPETKAKGVISGAALTIS